MGNRSIITLECTACKERNYSTTKNKKKTQDKLALSKYCPRCRKHTPQNRGLGVRIPPGLPPDAGRKRWKREPA